MRRGLLQRHHLRANPEAPADRVARTHANYDEHLRRAATMPSVRLALPLDPTTSAEAFRPAVEAGTKIVLLSNTPAGYKQGKDFVAVVTDDLFAMGKNAADALAASIGKKGKVASIFHDAQYYVT